MFLPKPLLLLLLLLQTFSFFQASAYANLNSGIPYTFLVLLDTYENILLQFFDNSKMFLSFRSIFQKFSNFKNLNFFKKFQFFNLPHQLPPPQPRST